MNTWNGGWGKSNGQNSDFHAIINVYIGGAAVIVHRTDQSPRKYCEIILGLLLEERRLTVYTLIEDDETSPEGNWCYVLDTAYKYEGCKQVAKK